MNSVLRGTPVVAGVAHGPALTVHPDLDAAAVNAFGDGPFADADAALTAYDTAVEKVAQGYSEKSAAASGSAAQVLAASAGLAKDAGLRGAVQQQLGNGLALVPAVRAAVGQFVDIFTNMGGLMAERATDLADIERRVIARIIGEAEPGVPTLEAPAVIVADDLAPAETAVLDPALVLAIVTARGGPTSHTAIIARQHGIPCVVGVHGALDITDGTDLLVDGGAGTIELDADPERASKAVETDARRREASANWSGPGATADGHQVKILANVTGGKSAEQAAPGPVEGSAPAPSPG